LQVHSLLELNVISTTYMTRLVLPKMTQQKRGAIVNLSSAAAKNPSPLLAEYSGAKSFIEVHPTRVLPRLQSPPRPGASRMHAWLLYFCARVLLSRRA
jgi:NAD(P)-dependent dehydrogenase (short-subunit alcohol dehydrogenase family)